MDEATRKAIGAQMSKLVGEDFIKDLLQQGTGIFPDSAVAEGAEWSNTSVQKSEMAFNAKSQFKLVEIGDSTARIKMNASLESIPGTPDQLLAAGSAKLKGSQDGELTINTATGMISNAKVKGKISGKVMVLYNEVPLTITTERHTTTRIL